MRAGLVLLTVLAAVAACGGSPAERTLTPAVPGLPAPPPQDLGDLELPEGIRIERGRLFSEKDGAEMVLVSPGAFLMGNHGYRWTVCWGEDEAPAHWVSLSRYLIDRHPVTVGQYRRFCAETGRRLPDQPGGTTSLHPVRGVRYADARAYAAWAGRSLPTEAEWEKAGRGTDGRFFPWGDDEREWPGHAVPPVGSHPELASPCGALALVGEPTEWCLDWWGAYEGGIPRLDPMGPLEGDRRVVRGSSFLNTVWGPRGIYLPGIRVDLYTHSRDFQRLIPVTWRWHADPEKDGASFRCVLRAP